MFLFGPNIKKMKEKGDIDGLVKALYNPKNRGDAIKALVELKSFEGLIKALNSRNSGVRIGIAEALKDINEPEAINALNKTLINALKFGEMEEQVEAITLIQGREPYLFLSIMLAGDDERLQLLENVRKKLSLETFRDALLETVKQRKSAISLWYALVALVELGDRSNEVLQELIEFSDAWLKTLATEPSLFASIITMSVREETLRALSCFRGNSAITDLVVKAYEGMFLSGSEISEGLKIKAIYALGALGDPSARERLEYLASHSGGSIQKTSKISLELYGKATFDEIKAKAESK